LLIRTSLLFPSYTTGSLVALAAEGTALSEPGLATSRLAEHRLAARAHHHGLGVAEHSGSAITSTESWILLAILWFDQSPIKIETMHVSKAPKIQSED
jgi:hypothetical protein